MTNTRQILDQSEINDSDSTIGLDPVIVTLFSDFTVETQHVGAERSSKYTTQWGTEHAGRNHFCSLIGETNDVQEPEWEEIPVLDNW